jgi:hypothetical protein
MTFLRKVWIVGLDDVSASGWFGEGRVSAIFRTIENQGAEFAWGSPAHIAETLWHWHLSDVILAHIIASITLGIDRQDVWVF